MGQKEASLRQILETASASDQVFNRASTAAAIAPSVQSIPDDPAPSLRAPPEGAERSVRSRRGTSDYPS
ncbi:MAG TPA: hypothetical protein VEE86_01555 [Thermoplasmata archaeon]|nr:hypothetical protein [Thermoplasmata archaeon]